MSDALYADGFEDTIVGVGRQCHNELVVYDYDKCVQVLMDSEGMTYEEAVQWMEFNVVGSWVGANTPVFIKVGAKDFDEQD